MRLSYSSVQFQPMNAAPLYGSADTFETLAMMAARRAKLHRQGWHSVQF